jgi:hypothetical protein
MKNTKLFTVIAAVLLFNTAAWGMGARPPADTVPKQPTPTPTPKPAPTPVPTPPPTATPVPTPPPQTSDFKALWSGRHPDAVNWNGYVDEGIERYGQALLKGPADVEDFCPMYHRVGSREQLNFWIQLFAGITKYESNFDPTMRYTESTMGTDPVTGEQVRSEGLLQLSYQDRINYRVPQGVCAFDWQHDKQLGLKDMNRTIFDPKMNLVCGIWILNDQVARKGKIALSSGVYWATLKVGGRYSALDNIKAITQALPFCK